MTQKKLSLLNLILAVLLAILVPLVGSLFVQDYSHSKQYISELGAVGTEWGSTISFGGFLPIGVLVIFFIISSAPIVKPMGSAKIGYYLLLFVGLSYLIAAFAPCDIGCPAEGSLRQSIHNSLGVFEYILGGVGLILFARSYTNSNYKTHHKYLHLGAGLLVLISFFAMAYPDFSVWRGFFQRVAEFCLFGSLIVIWRASSQEPLC